jgi:NAD(P)H-nitrite reductase large subunit
MEAKKQNIPEKGVLVQRDMETYAVVPYFPGGVVDSSTLRRIADVAEKYNIKTIKTTSEGRIALYGVMKRI